MNLLSFAKCFWNYLHCLFRFLCSHYKDAIYTTQLSQGQSLEGKGWVIVLVADPTFNVIYPTSLYLAIWDTVQTKSSDRIYWDGCICVCVCWDRAGLLMEVCWVRRGVYLCAHMLRILHYVGHNAWFKGSLWSILMFPGCSLASFLNRSETVLSAFCAVLAALQPARKSQRGQEKIIYLTPSEMN